MDYLLDYYKILGLPATAGEDEIRRAYRTLALLWHPDRHAGESPERVAAAEENFKLISQAYRILSDPAQRSKYDWATRYRSRDEGHVDDDGEGGGRNSRQYSGSAYGYGHPQATAQRTHNRGNDWWASAGSWIFGFAAWMFIVIGDVFPMNSGFLFFNGPAGSQAKESSYKPLKIDAPLSIYRYKMNNPLTLMPEIKFDLPDSYVPDFRKDQSWKSMADPQKIDFSFVPLTGADLSGHKKPTQIKIMQEFKIEQPDYYMPDLRFAADGPDEK